MKLPLILAILCLPLVVACRGETQATVNFGLTTTELNNIISAGGSDSELNSNDYELVLVWPESSPANFHAALDAINASGNGEGAAQELLWGQILFAQTDRWELAWEGTGNDVGRMTFRIEAIPQYSPQVQQIVAPTAVAQTPLLPEQIFEYNANAVFTIGGFVGGEFRGNGSGFFINSTGAAISNHHVMEVASFATHIETHTGQHFEILGFYYYDTDNDLAIIQVNGTGFAYVALGNPASLAVGQAVYAIGTPYGLFRNAFTIGNVASLSAMSLAHPYVIHDTIMFTAPTAGGNSGGPLFNSIGEVIGVNQAGMLSGQTLNFAVPIDRIDFLALATGTLNPLPVPPFGGGTVPAGDLFDFLVGTWHWDGGYYTLNANQTGSRDWSTAPGSFNWDFDPSRQVLVIHQGANTENFLVTAINDNTFEISGFRFVRYQAGNVPSGDLFDFLVGTWHWVGGYYTLNANQTGSRDWNVAPGSFTWDFDPARQFLVIEQGAERENYLVTAINDNEFEISGLRFVRYQGGLAESHDLSIIVGEWIDVDGDIWVFEANNRFQITDPRTGQDLGSGLWDQLHIIIHNENSITASGWLLARN